MEGNKKLIIVPWDFTQVAENALGHAAKIGRSVGGEICLLHIVDENIKPRQEGEKKTLLRHIADEGNAKYNIAVTAQVKKGSIFNSIAEFVNSHNAELVVMGTHGMKGMQKITGSWALKVIVKSKVPFIVIQDPPPDQERYHNIVFPIDLNFAVKYLIQNNIEYEIHELPHGGKFAQKTIDFAHKINADLILIMTTKNITMADYMLGASEQFIIANSSRIPVCCVNPKASFAKVGQFMYG
jgi:nucleotide-binding universal stress UspA family protein